MPKKFLNFIDENDLLYVMLEIGHRVIGILTQIIQYGEICSYCRACIKLPKGEHKEFCQEP